MIDKMQPHVQSRTFNAGETIFREGDPGETFFMLRKGKVLLEQRISDKIRVSVVAIKPGYSFGWSAVLGDPGSYTLDAVCAEASDLFLIQRSDIRRLLEADHSMGYILMQRIVVVVKKRLDRRTEQFLRVIKAHPDIQPLVDM
jgi:CRP-like cAMP-binding protein